MGIAMLRGECAGKVTVSAKIIRKDGTVEDLGVIARSEPESKFKILLRKVIGYGNRR